MKKIKKIIITLEVDDQGKDHNEKDVIDTIEYFMSEERRVINALQEIHNIFVNIVGAKIEWK